MLQGLEVSRAASQTDPGQQQGTQTAGGPGAGRAMRAQLRQQAERSWYHHIPGTHWQDLAGQGTGREAWRVTGGGGRLCRTSDGDATDTRRGGMLRKVGVGGPSGSHQDIHVVRTVGPQKVPREGVGSEWRARGTAWVTFTG